MGRTGGDSGHATAQTLDLDPAIAFVDADLASAECKEAGVDESHSVARAGHSMAVLGVGGRSHEC